MVGCILSTWQVFTKYFKDLDFKLIRRTSFYLLNVFFIIFLLGCLSWWTYLIDPEVLNDRLQICITVFLALVGVNFVVAESLPRISHSTYLTSFFLLNYFFITLGAVGNQQTITGIEFF